MGRTLLSELGSAAPDVAIRSLDKAYPGGAGRGGYQFSDLARHPGARGGPCHPLTLPAHLPLHTPHAPHNPFSTHRMLDTPHASCTRDDCTVSPATALQDTSPATAPLGVSPDRPLNYLACYHPPGVIVVPYTKSAMSFFELYRMNVPLFYPSVALLTKWELGMLTSAPILTAHTTYNMHMHTPAWSRYSRRRWARCLIILPPLGARVPLGAMRVPCTQQPRTPHNNHAPHTPRTHLLKAPRSCRSASTGGTHRRRCASPSRPTRTRATTARRSPTGCRLATRVRCLPPPRPTLVHPSPTPRPPLAHPSRISHPSLTHPSGLLAFWLAAE